MVATFDRRTRTLRFPNLFPNADRTAAAGLRTIVAGRSERSQPPHKRLDARRARLALRVRGGHVSLSIAIRGGNDVYAVKAVLGVINEMFVWLHEHHHEYLVGQFGISSE